MAFLRLTLMLTVLLIGFTVVNQAQRAAGDVTQWRGANRDGVIAGFTEPAAWPERLISAGRSRSALATPRRSSRTTGCTCSRGRATTR